MNLDHLTDQKFYSDRDMTMLSCYIGDVLYTVASMHHRSDYLIDCNNFNISFKTDDPDMAHKIMKRILVKGEEHDSI